MGKARMKDEGLGFVKIVEHAVDEAREDRSIHLHGTGGASSSITNRSGLGLRWRRRSSRSVPPAAIFRRMVDRKSMRLPLVRARSAGEARAHDPGQAFRRRMCLRQFVGIDNIAKIGRPVDFDRRGPLISGLTALLWHFPVPVRNLVDELP